LPPAGLSFDNPLPLGHTGTSVGRLQSAVLAANVDAWPVIQAENQFNDPPELGKRMVLITLQATNIGQESLNVSFDPSFKLVGSKGVVYDGLDAYCGVIPDPLDGELFPGGAKQGNVCVQADADDSNLVLFVEMYDEDFDKERVFFALQ
jgi:hypothetical protein